jgi:hypothetical protein
MQSFFYNNLVKIATLTASTENAQFPLSNLKDDRRTKVFRSNGNADSIVFDFGFARSVDSVFLVDNGDALGVTSVTIEMNPTNSWGVPAFSQVVTLSSVNGLGYVSFASQSYRYARIVMTNTAGYCELSKIFIGEKAQLGGLSFSYPLIYQSNTNANVQRNRMNQKFFDKINTQKIISGSINTMNKDEVDTLLQMLDYTSFNIPLWVHFDDMPSLNDPLRLSGYYYLKDDPNLSLAAGNFWSVRLDLEEGT